MNSINSLRNEREVERDWRQKGTWMSDAADRDI